MKLAEVKNLPDNKFGIQIPKKKKFNSRDILRIQSQLISGFINGTVESNEAKTLSYLCSNFVNNLQAAETEQRLNEIEKQLEQK